MSDNACWRLKDTTMSGRSRRMLDNIDLYAFRRDTGLVYRPDPNTKFQMVSRIT